MEAQPTLRTRKRRAVQDEVMAVAVRLFAAQGYESTTVDQIATAAGMSPRTFFRYFAGKDDVMSHAFAITGAEITASLAGRPPREAPWTALRRAFDDLVDELERQPPSRDVMRMIYDTPTLYAGHLRKQAQWSVAIADALVLRLDRGLADRERRLRAGALAAAAVSCLETARTAWVVQGDGSLVDMVDAAMGAVSPLVPDRSAGPDAGPDAGPRSRSTPGGGW